MLHIAHIHDVVVLQLKLRQVWAEVVGDVVEVYGLTDCALRLAEAD